ncbi:MAG: ankyrin repeat domain-containing protein, partial [Bacteroidota bacterium]
MHTYIKRIIARCILFVGILQSCQSPDGKLTVPDTEPLRQPSTNNDPSPVASDAAAAVSPLALWLSRQFPTLDAQVLGSQPMSHLESLLDAYEASQSGAEACAGLQQPSRSGEGSSPAMLPADGLTPLHRAARDGDLDAVISLTTGRVDIDVLSSQGITALGIAAQNNHLDIAKYLYGKDASLQQIDANGYGPLYLAAYEGHLPMVQFICESE